MTTLSTSERSYKNRIEREFEVDPDRVVVPTGIGTGMWGVHIELYPHERWETTYSYLKSYFSENDYGAILRKRDLYTGKKRSASTKTLNGERRSNQLTNNPDLIFDIFQDCYEETYNSSLDDYCHVWDKVGDKNDKISIKNDQPIFGPAKFAPPPANNVYARRYIWAYMTGKPPPKQLTNDALCFEYCVNYEHLRSRYE